MLMMPGSDAATAMDTARLEIFRWQAGKLEKLGETALENKPQATLSTPHLQVQIHGETRNALRQWSVKIANGGEDMERLVLRVKVPTGKPGGHFWDGFELHSSPGSSSRPKTTRYRFPAAAYLAENSARVVGFAPDNLSSRFERSWEVKEGEGTLIWDAYLALHPSQEDVQTFITGKLIDCNIYPEVIEAYYLAYPDWFRPVAGADKRLYGAGGFFRSSGETRDIQSEEARRRHLDWEWCYAPFQRVGATVPDPSTWSPKMGFNVEETQSIYNEPGGLEAWTKYNTERFRAGNKTSGMFYYYLQQYCDVDLLKTRFTDSFWIDAKGKAVSPTFGWIKTGLWVQFAWPGETLYGKHLRRDLAKAWEMFDISGFALDCVIGDVGYYGEALPRENGKAFDDTGKVFVSEGVAIAKNIDYTHQLPARPDGQRAASISNEPVTYHGIFHADAMMHEKPPYERADLLPLRRLMAGQKPFYWWSGGYRAESTLNWENLSREDFGEAFQGAIDYVILTSLRFGGVPVVFLADGLPEVRRWIPRFIELQRAGWRAATFTRIPEAFRSENDDPFAPEAKIWVSRYGVKDDTWIVASSPNRKRVAFPLEIETARFGAQGQIYLDEVTASTFNRVSPTATSVDLTLEDHRPVLLKAVAEISSPTPVALKVTRTSTREKGETVVLQSTQEWPAGAKVRFIGEQTWRDCPAGMAAMERTTPPPFRFVPDDQWIETIHLGDDKQSAAAILILPEDREKLDTRRLHLTHYWEFYQLRRKAPAGALWSIKKNRNRALSATLASSLDDPALQKAQTIFVMGEGARRLAKENVSHGKDTIGYREENGRCWISVVPGDLDENALWGEFLARLDQRFPFWGALDHGPMFKQHQMEGTVFDPKTAGGKPTLP